MTRRFDNRIIFKNKIIYFLFLYLILTIALPQSLFAQEAGHIGTDFWLAFPENVYEGTGLYIQSDANANFTVTTSNLPFIYNSTVSPNSPKVVKLPVGVMLTSSEVIEGKGIHIVSDRPITVKGKTPFSWYGDGAGVSDDAYLGLPITAIGKEYIILAYQESVGRGLPSATYPSEFAIVGTEDGTTINITPSCTGINGTPANTPFSIILNQGQTYQYKCGAKKSDVTGTIITSNKPIAAFGGNRCAEIPAQIPWCDHLVEQIYPINTWGNDYITYPINNGTADLIRILSSQDGTTVIIDDGINPATITLDKGQFWDITTDKPTHITSDQPILAAQYGRGGAVQPYYEGRDPFMMLIIPTDLFLKEYRFFVPKGYTKDYINIIAPASAVSTITLDNIPVTGFTPIPNGNYQGASVPITTDGEHVIIASEPIGVYVYGFGGYVGYGYPAGIAKRQSGFNGIRLIDTISTANIDLDASSFSKQPVSITQDTQNNLTIIEWQYSSFSIGQIEKLNFDIILKNPIPGEDRLVNHKLELIYQDAGGNQIRKELGQQYVHVLSSNFNITPTTDKIEYNANENGMVNLTITNIGDMARTVDIHINMVDSIGNMVSQITVIPNTTFNAGQTLTFPNITFNTGNTFSGPYQIQATLYEQTNPAGRGKTDIAIKSPIPQLGISSGITTDKTAYNANENVRIASIVTSTASNYIYTNLTAKIKITNPNNQIITEYTRNIQTLMPNARNEGALYFNTASNPPGIYNVIQEIYQGTEKISQSATTFTILSTSQTGIGIAGTIAPNPKTIIRWQPIAINYNVTNIGNSGISDLNLKILIIDPETGNALITLTDTISQLSIGNTATNLKTIPNFDLIVTKKPKDYLIILQGTLPAGAVTIASSYITVMPPLNITKETKGNARALVWLCKENNNHHESHETDNECKGEIDPLEPMIKEALKQLGIYYYLIVYDKKDFETYLRSNEFNTYLIFNNHEPIGDHFDEELTEHINAGKGIIAFFIKKEEEHNNNDNNENGLPVFGVRFKGELPAQQRTLYLADTEVTEADTITTSGKVEKTELLPNSSAQIMAYFNDGTSAIITNTYGNGKAVLYTFDLRKTTETATQTQLTNLLKKAIKYTAPAKEETYISGGIIPVTIKIQNMSIPITLKIEEQLPPNATIITDSTAIRTGDVLSWTINIAANETKEITYYLIAPDSANITLNTNIYYLSGTTYELYDHIELKIDIKATITQITTPIIEKLNSLILTDKKADEERQDIIRILTELQNQTIPADKNDANKIWEEAIKKTLKAIEELKDIREQLQNVNLLDINTEKTLNEIRLLMDELLMFAEIKWYGTR